MAHSAASVRRRSAPSRAGAWVAPLVGLTLAAFVLAFYVQLLQAVVAKGAMARYSFRTGRPLVETPSSATGTDTDRDRQVSSTRPARTPVRHVSIVAAEAV